MNKGKNRFCYIASCLPLYTTYIVHHFIQIEGNPDFHVVLLSFLWKIFGLKKGFVSMFHIALSIVETTRILFLRFDVVLLVVPPTLF